MELQKVECDTCQDKGYIFQEGGAGVWRTCNAGHVICPDCGNPNNEIIPDDQE